MQKILFSPSSEILLGKTDTLTWFTPFALFLCLLIIQTQRPFIPGMFIEGFENIRACLKRKLSLTHSPFFPSRLPIFIPICSKLLSEIRSILNSNEFWSESCLISQIRVKPSEKRAQECLKTTVYLVKSYQYSYLASLKVRKVFFSLLV